MPDSFHSTEAASVEVTAREVDDQFFDKGWCWMSHPDWNIGNPIPVFMYEAEGTRFYVPLDPSSETEYEWDERDKEWQMIRPPMADLKDAIERDDLRADAARYRWLRDRLLAADFDWQGECVLVFKWPSDVPVGGNCDQNIDAAIARAQGAA